MGKKTFGYARVSTTEQNLDRQIQELNKFIVDDRDIYREKISGKNFERPEYNRMIGNLREGDLLVICSLDRLGRNYSEIHIQWQMITQTIGADIKVLDMPLLDTRSCGDSLDGRFIADLVLQILSYTAEKERENTRRRQRQGIDAMPIVNGKRISTKTGRAIGRPAATYPEGWEGAYSRWSSGRETATATMNALGLTRTTFYKLANRYREELSRMDFVRKSPFTV